MKPILNNINGILLLDKPLGMTSNGALQRIKRLFVAKKAGHTGSLDPLATGMLPICFGEATKFSQYLLDSDKCYSVTATLGERTTTGDAEGEIISSQPIIGITQERLEQVMAKFRGPIEQIPPMYSALKVQGQPLYKLARRGIEIERKPRPVTIFSLTLEGLAANHFKISVHCSKGTYIRTLVDDIGLALGCGAYVSELRRTAVTPYQQNKMYSLADIEKISVQDSPAALLPFLLPLESSVQSLPALELSTSAVFYLRMGQAVMAPKMMAKGLIRIFANTGEFLGIGEMMDDGRITPRRLLGFPPKMEKAV